MTTAFRTAGLLLVAMSCQAASPCATCHPKEAAGYAETGMAQSLTRAVNQPSGKFRHALSDSEFTITVGPRGMLQTLEREGITGSHRAAWAIGSGNHAFGYLVDVNGYLFQSPISYYTKRRIWDMAPGYEADRSPDFTRPVTAECLWCHSGKPLPVRRTLNRYAQPPFEAEAISCDRCHGPAEAHVRQPSRANIVNPKRLPARERDSTCEQCHLSGEARIPNPGREIGQFIPGKKIEDFFTVFVFDKPAETRLKVISHAEQLAQSMCRLRSGDRLWCGTCHNPHEKPRNAAAYYREKCIECHRSVTATHAPPTEDCAGCHMPSRPARDGGHTAFTDHEIQRRPAQASPPAPGAARALRAWRVGPASLMARNLGLAYVTVGERDRSAFHLDEGLRLLNQARAAGQNDPALLTSLGLLALRQRKSAEAIALFTQAAKGEPDYAPYLVNLATALNAAGRATEAAHELERAIELDPSLEPAYRRLAEIARQTKKPELLRQVFERYLRFMPQNVNAQIALQSQ